MHVSCSSIQKMSGRRASLAALLTERTFREQHPEALWHIQDAMKYSAHLAIEPDYKGGFLKPLTSRALAQARWRDKAARKETYFERSERLNKQAKYKR